jgi:hypothetical protein
VLTCNFFEINSGPWHHTRRPKIHHELDYVQLADAAKQCFSLKALFQLEGGGAHSCRGCGIVVHNTCAQERSWFVEDDLQVATSLLQ